MRLRTTHIQIRLMERGQSHMNQKVQTIATGTMSWRVYVGRLRSWSWS